MKVDTIVLFLILGGMLPFFFTIENNVCCRLIIYGLYYVEIGSFYAHFLKSFNHNWVLNFVKGFFCSYWDYYMVFIFKFVDMVYQIDWFSCIEESLHPWNKPNLIMVYELFGVLLNSVFLKFCWGFLHLCSSGMLVCSFLFLCCLCLVLVSGWWWPCRMSLEVFLCNFWKSSRRIGISSSLNVW